jgi:hypothetical protein
MTSTSIFPPEALDANRSGVLTPEQCLRFRRAASFNRGTEITISIVLMAAGVLLVRDPRAVQGWWAPLVGPAVLGVGGAILLHAFGIGNRVIQDVRAGRVTSIEGAIRKRQGSPHGRASTRRADCLIVEGRRFFVGPAAFAAAPEAGYVRLYYLPRSRRVANLEILPGRRSTDEIFGHPAQTLASIAADVSSGDATRRAEALADVASAARAWQSEQRAATAATETAPADRRPLAEAIVGRWEVAGLAHVEFRDDGTVILRRPIGGDARGRWSVGADGRLHSDVMGKDEAGDARVAGDVLTLSIDDMTLAFRRVRT